MQKIMFNDRYGLTEAVLNGRKTMTRRIIQCPKKAFCFEVGRTTRGGCLLIHLNLLIEPCKKRKFSRLYA